METIYRKVFIKSEADLPEETDHFTVHLKGKSKWFTDNLRYEKGDNSYWMVLVDWYLQPVELPSDEEIEQYAQKTTHGNTVNGAKWMRDKLINK